MNLKFKVHRNPRSDEEIQSLIEEFGDHTEWDGSRIFDPKNPDHLLSEPKVWLKCQRCGKETEFSYESLLHLNFGTKGLPFIMCTTCNVKKGIMFPRDLIE
jgi:hypothetical protein